MLNKRFLFLIPFLAISFLGCEENSNRAIAPFTTSFSPIGPFEVGDDDFNLTGTAKPNKVYLYIKEKMTVKTKTGTMIKTQVTNFHEVTKGVAYTLTFKLPIKSSLTYQGLNVLIEFINEDETTVHSFSFNLMPIKPETINPLNYINDYYVLEDIVVDPDGYSKKKEERIKFDQILDYFNVDNYYLLSLKDTNITYECPLPFSTCFAHLHFVDYLRIFPYLDSDEEVPTFDVPLRTIITSSGVRFAFPTSMYVNPQTLDMSLEARPDFVMTSNFYLPKNRCEELMDQVFTIDVKDFGYGKTSFSWNMRYTNNNRLIGDCSSSDYCVIGEVTNG